MVFSLSHYFYFKKKEYATPYNHLTDDKCMVTKKRMVGLHKNSVLFPALIVWNENAFYSKTFLIRFLDDQILVNDVCFFRFELEAYPKLFKDKVQLEL